MTALHVPHLARAALRAICFRRCCVKISVRRAFMTRDHAEFPRSAAAI
jgi:hypothetical protein